MPTVLFKKIAIKSWNEELDFKSLPKEQSNQKVMNAKKLINSLISITILKISKGNIQEAN